MTNWEEKNLIARLQPEQDHGVVVRRLGEFLGDPEKLAQRLADTEGMQFARDERFSCLECQDIGWVTIWHPKTITQAMSNPDTADWKTVVVLCKCDKADANAQTYSPRLRSSKAGESLPAFGDKLWHINARHPDAKAKAAMFKPENYNEAFAAFEKSA